MKEYIANGAQLGWLLDPETQSVTIFRPDQEPETRTGIQQIEGEGPVAGFILNLQTVWNPFSR
jgi:Uma2 family endonuclease